MSESSDYLAPIRSAAHDVVNRLGRDDDAELYAALIDFAGAILDATRAEAVIDRRITPMR